MERRYKRGIFVAPSPFFTSFFFQIKLPHHWITNWNLKRLTDSRHRVSAVRTQHSGSLTERVRSHLYPIPSPQGHPEGGRTVGRGVQQLNCRTDPEYCLPLHLAHEFLRGNRARKLHSILERELKVKSPFKHFDVFLFFWSGLVCGAAAAPNPHRKAFIWDWF